uniref:Uncharacterized protein n=1 Tax=Arundo donax TaxID=35708 RepID=A0A0A9CC65_ARUDO
MLLHVLHSDFILMSLTACAPGDLLRLHVRQSCQ